MGDFHVSGGYLLEIPPVATAPSGNSSCSGQGILCINNFHTSGMYCKQREKEEQRTKPEKVMFILNSDE